MQIINTELLDEVTEKAKESPRLRMNYNFHQSMDAKSQRLLNAVEPGTLLSVHRHLHTDETYVLLRGRIKAMIYNDKREVIESVVLDPLQGSYGVNIRAGEWHSIEVLESASVILETKDGPFTPISKENIL